MAVTVFKTYSAGEILLASDVNSSFSKIHDNGEDLGWPATQAKDLDGNALILDGDGDLSLISDVSERLDVRFQGTNRISIGHATGNTGGFFTIDSEAFTSTASSDIARLRIENNNVITVPAGTTPVASSVHLREPNLTATGTITDAATLYIASAPTEASNNYFLLIPNEFDVTSTGMRLGGANSRVDAILDEDDLVSDSNTALATQQSFKAYVDSLARFTKITSGVVSNQASLDITDLPTGDRAFIFVFSDLQPIDDMVLLAIRTSSDNGNTFDDGVGTYQRSRMSAAEAAPSGTGGTANNIALTDVTMGTTGTEEAGSGTVWIYDARNSGDFTRVTSTINYLSDTDVETIVVASGHRTVAEDNDAIRFIFSSGNIDTMRWTLYGADQS